MNNKARTSLRAKIALTFYVLISLVVTFGYLFTFGYSFWGTDKGALWLDIIAWLTFFIIMVLQSQTRTRVGSWMLLTPTYPVVLMLLSNMERFNVNIVYLGLVLTAVMMTLAALLNRFLRNQ